MRATARTASSEPAARCTKARDRKSTRLNSSHLVISYAVFCLKKKIRVDWRARAAGGPGRRASLGGADLRSRHARVDRRGGEPVGARGGGRERALPLQRLRGRR